MTSFHKNQIYPVHSTKWVAGWTSVVKPNIQIFTLSSTPPISKFHHQKPKAPPRTLLHQSSGGDQKCQSVLVPMKEPLRGVVWLADLHYWRLQQLNIYYLKMIVSPPVSTAANFIWNFRILELLGICHINEICFAYDKIKMSRGFLHFRLQEEDFPS